MEPRVKSRGVGWERQKVKCFHQVLEGGRRTDPTRRLLFPATRLVLFAQQSPNLHRGGAHTPIRATPHSRETVNAAAQRACVPRAPSLFLSVHLRHLGSTPASDPTFRPRRAHVSHLIRDKTWRNACLSLDLIAACEWATPVCFLLDKRALVCGERAFEVK